jgi:predicted DNA-binding transcriptional regulator YafY
VPGSPFYLATLTERPDGGVELMLKVGVSPELVRLVCGWQGYAKVIEPDGLKE